MNQLGRTRLCVLMCQYDLSATTFSPDGKIFQVSTAAVLDWLDNRAEVAP